MMKNQEESPTSPTIPLQTTDLTTLSATVTHDCRTTVSHIGTDKSAISVCNRVTNRRADCNTSLSHKSVAHRRRQRPTGLWLRGTVWQFRMRVPRDCVGTVGREFVNRSLRTSDYRQAIRHARIVAFEIEQTFRRTESGGAMQPQLCDPAREIASVLVRRQENAGPHPDAASASPQPIQPTLPIQPVMTLKEVYQRYIDDPAADRSAKTLLAYSSIFNRLVELVGENAPIKAVTREVCRDVLDMLRCTPPNATKRYGKISARAVVARAKAEGRASISPKTVNAHLIMLSALLNWAEKEGYIDKNPARGLRVADPVRKKDKRQPFSTEQLTRIFNAPLFRGCVDDEAGYARSGKNHPRRGRFWVPLIGLFSGMLLSSTEN